MVSFDLLLGASSEIQNIRTSSQEKIIILYVVNEGPGQTVRCDAQCDQGTRFPLTEAMD